MIQVHVLSFVLAFRLDRFVDSPHVFWAFVAMALSSAALYDERDLEILKFAVFHPNSTISDIAVNLGCRPETVSNHLRRMKDRGIYDGTMALLCYQKLDLAYVPVLVQAPIGNMSKLYQIVRAHPYIHYSVRTLGATNGGFLIFTVPRRTVGLLTEFLDRLASVGMISNHRLYVCDETQRDFIKPDLQAFHPQSGTWHFNWNKWAETIDMTPSERADPPLQRRIIQPETYSLGSSDMQLLSILSRDARVPIDEIASATKLPPHTVRRKIQSLEDNGFIIGYRAMIGFSKLHLPSSMMFNCNARPDEVDICRRRLLELPFPGFFLPVQNGFLCQVALPPEGLPPVQRFLAQNSSQVSVSWCDLPTIDVIVLNWHAYRDHEWRVDRRYMIEEPLSRIGKTHSIPQRPLNRDQGLPTSPPT